MTNATVHRNSLRFIGTVLLTAGLLLMARPAAAATVIISGVVQDTSGLTLDGVTVKLTGSSQATASTDIHGVTLSTASGIVRFVGGSYSVTPAASRRLQCVLCPGRSSTGRPAACWGSLR